MSERHTVTFTKTGYGVGHASTRNLIPLCGTNATLKVQPLHNEYLTEGYAVGYSSDGKWLAVFGIAWYATQVVFPTREAAEHCAAWFREQFPAHQHNVMVRRVRRDLGQLRMSLGQVLIVPEESETPDV